MLHRSFRLLSLCLVFLNAQAQANFIPSTRNTDLERRNSAVMNVRYDEGGQPLLSISAAESERILKFHRQCMIHGDGMYCDAKEGSCSQGTCGDKNSSCKPILRAGTPVLGDACLQYAVDRVSGLPK